MLLTGQSTRFRERIPEQAPVRRRARQDEHWPWTQAREWMSKPQDGDLHDRRARPGWLDKLASRVTNPERRRSPRLAWPLNGLI